jgi:hypothetical protein
MPLWRHCFLSYVLAATVSFILLSLVYASFILAGFDDSSLMPPDKRVTLETVFSAVVFAPVVETLLLAGGLKVISLLTHRKVMIASLSAAAWGYLHSLVGPLAFIGTFWSFFVFSCTYMAWRKTSFVYAYTAAAAPHALLNITALFIAAVFHGS